VIKMVLSDLHPDALIVKNRALFKQVQETRRAKAGK
jgi:hypothetical protein